MEKHGFKGSPRVMTWRFSIVIITREFIESPSHHASRDATRHANERSFAQKIFIMHAVVARPTTLATRAGAPRERSRCDAPTR